MPSRMPMSPEHTAAEVHKPANKWSRRDTASVAIAVALLVAYCFQWREFPARSFILSLWFPALFAGVAYLIRGATVSGAICGFAVLEVLGPPFAGYPYLNSPKFLVLLVFFFTWLATRL